MKLKALSSLKNLNGKRVLLRVDLNVPMVHGKVADDTRIQCLIPTIEWLLKNKAKVIVLSHFGRPKGEVKLDLSLAPLADSLSKALGGKEVRFALDCVGILAKEKVDQLQPGEIVLLENLRFHKGEEANDPQFTKALAELGQIYVNDAFSCSHRAHASTTGLAELLPSAAGLSLEQELSSLETLLSNPEKPMMAIVGGSKISTKLELLHHLVEKVQFLAIGGGMANTFLYAKNIDVGRSLCEKELKSEALAILAKAEKNNCRVIIPSDVVIADGLKEHAHCQVVGTGNIPRDAMILDIGPDTITSIAEAMRGCKTVVWNGPVGAFEIPPFDTGSISIARSIARLTGEEKIQSIAGGGDVLGALARAGLKKRFTYISTAGGAFLEWLEGKSLPGIIALQS